MFTLELARARILDLQREAARHSLAISLDRPAGRLRSFVARKRLGE